MSRRALPAVVLVPLLVVALVVSSSACGTMANFNGGSNGLGISSEPQMPPVAYGGVQWDIERAIKFDASVTQKAIILPLWLLDLSLSATLDTVTLPVVFWMNARMAWDRATGDPTSASGPTNGMLRGRGWFFKPNTVTVAEEILNPPTPPADEPSDHALPAIPTLEELPPVPANPD